MTKTIFSREFLLLLAAIVIISLWRESVLLMQHHALYVDEAYYWLWSKNLDWGYYSKPPVIAAIIALSTSVCSDTEACVRAGSILLYPLTTLLIFAITSHLFNRRYAFYAALTFFTIPAVSLSSLLISTDVALLFFWSLCLLAFLKALETNGWIWWLLVGIAAGGGMMSKYTMGVFAFSALFYLLLQRKRNPLSNESDTVAWMKPAESGFMATPSHTSPVFRKLHTGYKRLVRELQKMHLTNPRMWAAVLIAFLIWLPNLWWNYQHDFITFNHTAEISDLDEKTVHWDELGEFLGGQFAVFGLLLFPLYIYWLFTRDIQGNPTPHRGLLVSFSLTFLIIICLQAFLGRANANWAAPAYVTASIFVVAGLMRRHKQWLIIAAIVTNLLMAAGLYYYEPMAKMAGITLTARNDPYKRLKGWKEIGAQFAEYRKIWPQATLLSHKRDILSELNYYAQPPSVASWNPDGKVHHHFDLLYALQNSAPNPQGYLFVLDKQNQLMLNKYFEIVKPLPDLSWPLYADYKREYKVYFVNGFRGY